VTGEMDLDAAVDALYGLPLGEFVAARDELAARVRRESGASAAAPVRRLRKPSVAAWACNQLARRRTEEVERLLAVTERARAAARGGEGAEVRRGGHDRAALVASLVRAATTLLEDAGLWAGRAQVERIRGTLLAATADPQARDRLRAGRLTEVASGAVGFEAFGAEPLPEGAPGETRAPDEGRLRTLEAAARKAEERATHLEEVADDAFAEAERARRAAREARAAAAGALARLEAARAGDP
jgi:hypothetical protein